MTDRVLVLGLDGANREALIHGMNNGELPTFARIAEAGSIDTLESPLPPITPVSMASLLTGTDPDVHGVFSFEHDPRDGDGYVGPESIAGDTLFDVLDRAGKTSIAINVPMTDTALPADVVVAGFPHDGGEVAEPADLEPLLRGIGYRVEPTGYNGDLDRFVQEVFDLAEKRFRVAAEIIDRDWDLFFLMFTGDARLQHYSDDEVTVLDFYRRVDGYLSDLLDAAGDDVTVLVVSDHGFHDLETVLDLERWLQDAGHLSATGSGDDSRLYGALSPDRYDWDSTTAYPGAAYLGNIYCSGADADALRDDLLALQHDGEKVFRAVHRTADLYGDCDGPDLIPVPRRRYNYVAGLLPDLFDTDPEEQRAPDPEGVILTDADVPLDRPTVTDVRPLLLDLLDVDDA